MTVASVELVESVDGEDGPGDRLASAPPFGSPQEVQEPRRRCSARADAIRTAAAATPSPTPTTTPTPTPTPTPSIRGPGISPAGDALTAVREGSPTSLPTSDSWGRRPEADESRTAHPHPPTPCLALSRFPHKPPRLETVWLPTPHCGPDGPRPGPPCPQRRRRETGRSADRSGPSCPGLSRLSSILFFPRRSRSESRPTPSSILDSSQAHQAEAHAADRRGIGAASITAQAIGTQNRGRGFCPNLPILRPFMPPVPGDAVRPVLMRRTRAVETGELERAAEAQHQTPLPPIRPGRYPTKTQPVGSDPGRPWPLTARGCEGQQGVAIVRRWLWWLRRLPWASTRLRGSLPWLLLGLPWQGLVCMHVAAVPPFARPALPAYHARMFTTVFPGLPAAANSGSSPIPGRAVLRRACFVFFLSAVLKHDGLPDAPSHLVSLFRCFVPRNPQSPTRSPHPTTTPGPGLERSRLSRFKIRRPARRFSPANGHLRP